MWYFRIPRSAPNFGALGLALMFGFAASTNDALACSCVPPPSGCEMMQQYNAVALIDIKRKPFPLVPRWEVRILKIFKGGPGLNTIGTPINTSTADSGVSSCGEVGFGRMILFGNNPLPLYPCNAVLQKGNYGDGTGSKYTSALNELQRYQKLCRPYKKPSTQ